MSDSESSDSDTDEETVKSFLQESIEPSPHQISILHVNAQSLRFKIDQLYEEAANYDLVAVSETWLHPDIPNTKLELKGFHTLLRKDRDGEAYGGVILYAKPHIIIKQRQDLEERNLELLWAEIQVTNTKILLGVIYRPPNAPAETWAMIENNLANAKSDGQPNIVLIGDINNNQLVQPAKATEIFETLHMEQLIKEPTHITENSQTLIDIVATNCYDLINSSKVKSPSLSNHCDLEVTLNLQKPHVNKFKRLIYDYNRADWTGLKDKIKNTDWAEVLGESSIDDQAKNWTSTFIQFVKEYIPNKIITTRPLEKPYYSDKINRLRRRRQRAHKKAKRTGTLNDWDTLRTCNRKQKQPAEKL